MQHVIETLEELCQKILAEEKPEVKGELVKAAEAYINRAGEDFKKALFAHANQIIDPSEDRSEEEVDAKNEDHVDVEGRDNG